MARKNEAQATALAPVQNDTSALALDEALEGFDFGLNDGLAETDASDMKLPVIVWNMKGQRADGKMHQLNEFYDTLNERSFPELRCAFIHLHKSNSFTRYLEDKAETEIVCTSNDRQRGVLRVVHNGMPVGTERPCESCPDAQWRRNEKGKNVRDCSEIYGVFAVMLRDDGSFGDGFFLRFKKTSLPAFRTHLQKHHLGKRQLPGGKRANVPLFAFGVRMTLSVDKGGNYAVPVIERGDVLPREAIASLAEQAKFFAEIGAEATAVAEKQEAKHEAAPIETTGEPLRANDFAD